MMTGFITGSKKLADWDSYLKTCEDLHATEILAVKQAIYKRLESK